MIEHAETSYDAAMARVKKAATTAEAAKYLFWEVSLRTLRLLAQKTGLRIVENSDIDMQWCERLAERLRGNPVA